LTVVAFLLATNRRLMVPCGRHQNGISAVAGS
jgi:hypothetical protein